MSNMFAPNVDVRDYFAILNLVHRYADAHDRANFDEIGQLFHHADVYVVPNEEPLVKSGTGEFGDLLRTMVRVYPEGLPRTRLLVTNHQIYFENSNTARARSYFTLFQDTPAQVLKAICAGTYDDRFSRREDVWQFVERREAVTALGDLSDHLVGDMAAPLNNASR